MAQLEDFFEGMSSDWIVLGLHIGHGSKRTISHGELKGLAVPGRIQISLDRLRCLNLLDDSEDVVDIFHGSFGRISPKFVTRSQVNKLCHDLFISEVSVRLVLTKVGNEEVRNESPNDRVFEVFPISVGKLISRNVFSMRKIGSPCRLVFDVRKKRGWIRC